MRTLTMLFSFLAVIGFAIPQDAEAARGRGRADRKATASSFKKACPSVVELPRCAVYKSKQSPHIPSGDPRKNSTALIGVRPCGLAIDQCVVGYNRAGVRIHSMGAYNPAGSLYTTRVYGGWGCGDKKTPTQVKNGAKSKGGDGALYLRVNSRQCVKIEDPQRCYNSVGC